MKHILYTLLLVLCVQVNAQIIPVPESPTPTSAEVVANTIVHGINAQLDTRIKDFKNLWDTLWENPRATPEVIFEELGSRGGLVLLAGSLAVEDIERCAQAVGKTATQLLGDPKYLTVKLPVTIHEDGTVTINE